MFWYRYKLTPYWILINNNLLICYGHKQANGTTGGLINVIFPLAFNVTPALCISPYWWDGIFTSQNMALYQHLSTCVYSNLTKSQFTCQLSATQGWIAIGY